MQASHFGGSLHRFVQTKDRSWHPSFVCYICAGRVCSVCFVQRRSIVHLKSFKNMYILSFYRQNTGQHEFLNRWHVFPWYAVI